MIKFVVFDYDGVFTDGNVIVLDNFAIKSYNCKDGTGISLLKNNNIYVGIISAHKLDTNIQDVVKHLKIDFYSQGKNDKLSILTNWMNELNINFNEVAYIGDDIADIPILEKVGFSSCPNDAINECKNTVDYICKNNGGDGCIREFIDIILNDDFNDLKLNTIKQIKTEVIYQLNNLNNIDFNFITNKILKCTGNIYITGVGKSENMSIQAVNLLKSIGLKTFYINIMNLTHGDIGCINENDLILFFSKSGNTKEIINIIHLVKCFKIGICCNKQSLFRKNCDYNIVLPFQNEIKNIKNIDCIPSNSYMSQLLFVNILMNHLIEKSNITLDDYKLNHPAGNIGDILRKVKDIMIKEFPKILINNNENIKLNTVLLEMTKYNIGCCFFVNSNDNLQGLLTDGDIRRLLLSGNKDIEISINNINTDYNFIDNCNLHIKDILKNEIYKKSKFIPVIENNKIISIIDYKNI